MIISIETEEKAFRNFNIHHDATLSKQGIEGLFSG